MELRELRYFLAVAREQSISKAAEVLYITQPSLSRQMQNLEKELGQQLFVRGSKQITLTEAGILLRKRAEELISLYDKVESELTSPPDDISGDIYIGGGESYTIELIAEITKEIQDDYPNVRFHFFSADTNEVSEKLDKGLIDFGILVEPANLSKYNFLRLPKKDTWGLLVQKTHPLASRSGITVDDLLDIPLIVSKHSIEKKGVFEWMNKTPEDLNIVATYNLLYNASLLVKAGVGSAVTLDKIINTSGDSPLCFIPLTPRLETTLAVVWKRYQVFTKAGELFLEKLRAKVK